MKTLTIKQPYATLIAEGKKMVEVRTWRTHFRGPLYIHAGKGIYSKESIQKYRNVIDVDTMPKGAIIAKCELVDCVELTKEYIDEYNKKNKHLGYTIGYNSIGAYGFVLDNIEMLDKEIKINGKLSFWEYNE